MSEDIKATILRTDVQHKKYEELDKFFRNVRDLVVVERAAEHGDLSENFKKIAEVWNMILEKKLSAPISASDVGMMMMGLKLARSLTAGYNTDNYKDLAGYAGITQVLKQSENGDL